VAKIKCKKSSIRKVLIIFVWKTLGRRVIRGLGEDDP
jgi:hypothetical protein